MNKLKTTFTAGVPFDWDDIDWMQESTRKALYGLLSAYGIDPEDSLIISGCNVTIGPSVAITSAGYIMLNGEVLEVEAHSITYDNSSPVVWRLLESDDVTGAEVDSTGATVQCYQKRVAVLYQATSYTGEMPYNADRLADIITTIRNLIDDWVSVAFSATYFTGTNLTLNSTTTKLQYKIIGSTMIFSFIIGVTSMDSSVLKIDVAAATNYQITKNIQNAAIQVMTANNGPLLAMAVGSGPYKNLILLTEYEGVLDALTSATIYGEIIMEVALV